MRDNPPTDKEHPEEAKPGDNHTDWSVMLDDVPVDPYAREGFRPVSSVSRSSPPAQMGDPLPPQPKP